jgi:hypothetical protein
MELSDRTRATRQFVPPPSAWPIGPEAAFEAAFAIYLIVKGFRPSPILDDAR